MVGNEVVRGISGGQKKRVTTGEMLVGPARALFMDEISTGLDSSTTFQIVKSIRQSTHILDATTVISLLQPAPETFELFDDIVLLSEGQIVYQGPREHVVEFFESMGFQCPKRKGVADFLQEVTSKKDQEQYWSLKDRPYAFVTVKEFAEAFQSFHVGKSIGEELASPFDKSNSHPAALATEKYGVERKQLFKACVAREVLLLRRKAFIFVFKIFQLFVMAVIGTSVFFRTKMHRDNVTDGGIYMGALFFGVSSILFNSMQEMFLVIAKLPVFYKQRDFLFYPSWAFSLSTWIVKIPFSFLEAAALVFVTYYGIGYDHDVTRFIKQYFLAVILSQMAFSLFRTIGAIGRETTVAFTLGAFVLCVLFGLSGFVISRDYIKKWWIWGYWASPMMYGQNAIVVNEFLGKSWSHIGPNSTQSLGVEVLKAHGVFPHDYWYWIGVGGLIGYVCLFTIIFTIALTFLRQFIFLLWFVKLLLFSYIVLKTETEGNITASTSRKRGMVLPFQPHSLTFDQMTYSIDMPQEMTNRGVLEDRLVLIKGVSGSFRPGILTALMGVTGAGKTTLMDVLAGRKTGGKIEGDLRISGYPKKQETFARVSGYCEQTDIHSPHVTVHESLIYSAWLRLPVEVDVDTRMMFVEQVMELVELNDLRQALVGLPGVNGLSTEQRKRLTIAVELVANPSIVFMDEPTSGLDARAAAIVMRAVRNTVDTGRTVVCTIHQPSIDIFESFDELLLLKRGGQEIYVGPLGTHSSLLIDYFQGIKGVSKIKDGYNPATWMMEVSCSAQEVALGVDFATLYKNSNLYERNKELIKELSTPASGSRDLYFPSKYPQSFATQFGACLWKQNLSYWRNPSYTAVNLLFTTIIALMIGTMFWNLGQNVKKRQDLMNVMGSMYVSVYFLGVKNSSAVQAVVAIERTISYRERAAGMYSALSHAFAQLQVVIEIPYLFVQATIYTILTYAMIGYDWTATKFLWQFFFMFFTLLYFTFYGMMVMAVSPNYPIASLIASTFYGLWNIFSGFLIPRTRIPIWWRWFYWVCPVAWTLYGSIVAQYGDVQNEIESGETVEEFLRSYMGFRHDFLGVAATVVVCFGVFFALVFAFSMKNINYLKR
ncbi:unnamed protein product [Linum tenue]|uniref:ABC transporter domain-containing protein n=1 Tax=Linum tenue TaxID=586396 RepID=A0AAV0KM56_9ROSI|nr:unnamed protein product [Linum tenue]